MASNIFSELIKLNDNRDITLETGKLAKQANGSVVVKSGGTVLLATAVVSEEPKEGVDFLPLTVEYQEKFSAYGKIPGGFLKRESRPNDEEILTMRMVDRVIRPMFPDNYHNDIQISINLISYDDSIMPDSLSALACSAALIISDIPFKDPISEVRVVKVDGNFIINPSSEDIEKSSMDIIVGASKDSIIMIEGNMKEISEKELIEAIKFGHDAIKDQIEAQIRLLKKLSPPASIEEEETKSDDDIIEKEVKDNYYSKIYDICKSKTSKKERTTKFNSLSKELEESSNADEDIETFEKKKKHLSKLKKDIMRELILKDNFRLDGRRSDEIRQIECDVNYLPGCHGSAIFTRGETQSLTTVTLGGKYDTNKKDTATSSKDEKFYLHYNFPSFSTGEVRASRGVSRREVGHGNLAQSALKNVIPKDNPYTIRVLSDILESNGSSSMATVCASTMALLDSGINIKHVSGIAMGLIFDEKNDNYCILSDILGDEDHIGDMDFKVAGTKDGITACQMDIKIKGISYSILEKALEQARKGRLSILEKIVEAIPESRETTKDNAPKIYKLDISKEFIGAVIGPGGKNIQALQSETETTISITEGDDNASIEIIGMDSEKMKYALDKIKSITTVFEVGKTYKVKIKSIVNYGAFVEFNSNTSALLHISEIDSKRIDHPSDIISVDDIIEVKIIGKDQKTGKFKVSRKALL